MVNTTGTTSSVNNVDVNVTDLTVHLGSRRAVEYHSRHAEDDWIVTLAETGPTA